MHYLFSLPKKLLQASLRWRWPIVFALIIVITGARFLGYLPSRMERLDVNFLRFTLIYGLAFPLSLGILLSWMHTSVELHQILRRSWNQRMFVRHLANVKDLNELSTLLLQFPRTIVPLLGDSLSIYEPSKNQFHLAAAWSQSEKTIPRSKPCLSSMYCSVCMSIAENDSEVLVPCCCMPSQSSNGNQRSFCMPFLNNGCPVAILHLFLPPDAQPTSTQTQLLTELAPEVAATIDRVLIKRSIEKQNISVRYVQEQLARNLHDTVAHNIAYLRLKLDQLSVDEALQDRTYARHEIQSLCSIADQSYDQVRNSLMELLDEGQQDLLHGLKEYAHSNAERANFEMQIINEGEKFSLPLNMQRQLLYIIREALRNVEKHADARHVNIKLLWSKEHLVIVISDDGRGFDPSIIGTRKGHYGLRIMKECMEEMNGTLSVTSSKGGGTSLVLWLPV